MSALLVLLMLAADPPERPLQRVTICNSDGGACSGGSGAYGLTDTQLRASAVPVSLASVPTHAVTGTLTCNAGTGTLAVSLASVPSHAVTGPITDAQLRASAVPVSGTFFQATQPISISAALPTGDNTIGRVTVTSAPTTAVTGTFWQATQPVSGPATNAEIRASALVVTEGSATRWSCFVPLTTTATTQCQAAPGASLRLYVTSIACSNGAATVQGADVVYGTGTNCATGITALTHKLQMGTNGLTTSPFIAAQQFLTPLVPPQNVAICVRPTAAAAFGCTLTGYTAP